MRPLAILLLCAASCRPPESPDATEGPPPIAVEPILHASTWAAYTQSLPPGESLPCGYADDALARVATAAAEARAKASGIPDADFISLALRASGDPHPNPRVLLATGRSPVEVQTKLGSLRTSPETRCGIGRAVTSEGKEILVAVALDARADLSPLPIRARTGEWLAFDARMKVHAKGVKLVLLGPRGAPRTVPISFDGTTAHARFALDRPGAFSVQLVADLDSGPYPVIEAKVFSDIDPPEELEPEPAPGEDRTDLGSMIAATRVAEARTELRRDQTLDGLALEHAQRMRNLGKVAHDLGDGDLTKRFEDHGLEAKLIGENVAHAPSLVQAHRGLYASPSHRANLIRPDFTHVGVGIAEGIDGTVWVCEVFATADGLRPFRDTTTYK